MTIGRDHEGRAAGIFRPLGHARLKSPGDLESGVRRHRKRAAAGLHGESLQGFQIVARQTHDLRTQFVELRHRFGEQVRFDRAAGSERLGIEIQHHRPLAERVGQGELVGFAVERGIRGETRRKRTRFQCGPGDATAADQHDCEQPANDLHDSLVGMRWRALLAARSIMPCQQKRRVDPGVFVGCRQSAVQLDGVL